MHLNVRDRGNIIPGAHRLQKLLSNTGAINSFPAILVTGTNGKGTVCAFLESIFRHHNIKTGLYTSPHLVSVTERIRINGEPLSQANLDKVYEIIQNQAKTFLPDATTFELLTAAAIYCFNEARVEIAIVEIGLGGLFDSTNAISPTVSVITSIGLDHLEYLGKTEQEIATDKAYISRRNRDLIVGHVSALAQQGIEGTCKIVGSNLHNSENKMPDFFEEIEAAALSSDRMWLTLNKNNIRTTIATLQSYSKNTQFTFDPTTVITAFTNTFWPGRFDFRTAHEAKFIFDAAHNEQGATMLCNMLEQSNLNSDNLVLVYASLTDKNWKKILPMLDKFVKKIILTQVFCDRTVLLDEIIKSECIDSSKIAFADPCLKKALDFAINTYKFDNILVTGSLALVGEAMENLNIDPFPQNRL